MHDIFLMLDVDLRLFDGAAGAPAGGDSAGGDAPQATESLPKAETNARRGGSRRTRSGEYENVVFGKQIDGSETDDVGSDAGSAGEGNANKSGVETTSSTLEERRRNFEELINGEYKDLYTEKFQETFDRRFKGVKGMEDALNSQKPIMEILGQRYGVSDGDAKKILEALEEDTGFYEEAAEDAGLTVEQYKAMQKLERENKEFRAMQERAMGERAAQQQLAAWYRDAENVKATYPTFDLRSEIQNQQFQGLLKAGIPMQQAYELVHMEEIKDASARAAAKSMGEQMTARMKSKASRPKENGTSNQSAVIVKNDVSSFSRADRAEIARLVQLGETIIL